ncbi:hypothetical protein MO867_22750, partial [Microbulbifer sp. OS29]
MKLLTSIAVGMFMTISINTFADNNEAILFQVGNHNVANTFQSDPTIHDNLIVHNTSDSFRGEIGRNHGQIL